MSGECIASILKIRAEYSGPALLDKQQKTTPVREWTTYSPSRPGDSSTYVIVFGCDFTSEMGQKTTLARRWATYPADRSADSSAYAIVFGCDFTSASELFHKVYWILRNKVKKFSQFLNFFQKKTEFFEFSGRFFKIGVKH